MRTFLTVVGFSLFTVIFFSAYSNYGIPQIEPAPPPTDEKIDLGGMTMDQFVALGERIYKGKGTCTLCHNAVGGRAPQLERVGTVVKKRLADARYKGKAATVEEYLYESITDPSIYVVAGFGKAQTNDTVSPMPNARSGAAGLSEAELRAVVAYLQKSSGVEVTVKIPADAPKSDDGDKEEKRPLFKTVEAAIEELACGACHKIAGEEGDVGPDLTRIGAARSKEHIRRSILDPEAEITKGFKAKLMPADYGVQLYARELEMLVDYLAGLK